VQFVRGLADGDVRFILDCTIKLAAGNLMFYGAGDFSQLAGDGATFAVIGGTGRYTGAEGFVTVKFGEVRGGNGAVITFHLTPH